MKKNIHKNRSKGILTKLGAILSLAILTVSCGAYPGGYSETDGVYYDPQTDTLPTVYSESEYNQVGDYYSYDEPSIFEKSIKNTQDEEDRYQNNNWNSLETSDSDWGNYAGSITQISNSAWDYGYGSSLYSGFWPTQFSFSLGWGYSPFFNYRPWAWGHPYYDPWGFGYSPYYGSNSLYGYGPYYGYGGYYGYGYGGYGNGYYNATPHNTYRAPRLKSGADGNYRNPQTNRMNQTAGFRNSNTSTRSRTEPRFKTQTAQRLRDAGFRNSNAANRQGMEPRYRNTTEQRRRDAGFGKSTPNRERVEPRFENRTPQRAPDSGFRNYNSGSSGNYRGVQPTGSSSSSGSSRSSGTRGGFR